MQNSFMDSIHALGISFHSIGPWRPTAIRDLTPGTQLTVRFKSGQATGRVTEATSKWANFSFHDRVYSVDTRTSYTMHIPCHAVMDYSRPSHFQLVPEFLRPQETIPEPPARTAQRTRTGNQPTRPSLRSAGRTLPREYVSRRVGLPRCRGGTNQAADPRPAAGMAIF